MFCHLVMVFYVLLTPCYVLLTDFTSEHLGLDTSSEGSESDYVPSDHEESDHEESNHEESDHEELENVPSSSGTLEAHTVCLDDKMIIDDLDDNISETGSPAENVSYCRIKKVSYEETPLRFLQESCGEIAQTFCSITP